MLLVHFVSKLVDRDTFGDVRVFLSRDYSIKWMKLLMKFKPEFHWLPPYRPEYKDFSIIQRRTGPDTIWWDCSEVGWLGEIHQTGLRSIWLEIKKKSQKLEGKITHTRPCSPVKTWTLPLYLIDFISSVETGDMITRKRIRKWSSLDRRDLMQ